MEEYKSFDAIGTLLCIRVNTEHQLIMQKRRIPILDPYLNGLNLLLWPRFKQLLDRHQKSVQALDPKKMGRIEPHPHYVSFYLSLFFFSVDTVRF
jgi:hypothetical protein